jgi:hypothetical protein
MTPARRFAFDLKVSTLRQGEAARGERRLRR